MDKREIIASVKSLNLPDDDYIIFGSSPMAVAGIRTVVDIDLMVTNKLYDELLRRGWFENIGIYDTKIVRYGVFEASDDWRFGNYRPIFSDLRKRAKTIDSVVVASLEDVREYKNKLRREKDIVDIQLIDEYLKGYA